MHFVFILCLLLHSTLGWEKYEKSLVEPGNVPNNKHEFVWEIDPKLTMSMEQYYRRYSIIDYDINNQSWEERVENQLRPCLETIRIANGTDPLDYNGHIGNISDLIQFHGLHARVPAVNGLYPAEPLIVMFGTEVVIRIRNMQLLNSLTLRVHGLDNDWYQDGEGYLQQCPIPVRSEYVYRFTANRQGTMIVRAAFPFYSPITSFSGIMVVKKRNERLSMSSGPPVNLHLEYMLSVIDWPFVQANQQHITDIDKGLSKWGFGLDRDQQKCSKGGSYFGQRDIEMQQPSALIINDKGWYSQDDILNRASQIPLTTFRIKSGQNTLFRIAHLGFELGIRIHIEDHDSILVVADGTHTIPQKIDAIIFYPGERYNFHFQGKASPTKKVYRIVLQTVEKFVTEDGSLKPIYGIANLEYEDIEEGTQDLNKVDWEQSECTIQHQCVLANCQDRMDPRYKCLNVGELGFPDKHEDINILGHKVYSQDDLEEHFISMNQITKVDGYSYKSPDRIPYYNDGFKSCDQAICNRESVAHQKTECSCFHYKKFTLGKIVQLVIYNMGPTIDGKPGREIPFHLHSTHFFLVKWAAPVYTTLNDSIKMFNPDIICENPENGCFDGRWANEAWIQGNVPGMSQSPGLRDTVIIPYGGYIVIRFRARKAGWFMAESMRTSERKSGLAFAFKVGNQDQMPKPPSNFPKDCGHFEAPPLSLEERETVYRTINM